MRSKTVVKNIRACTALACFIIFLPLIGLGQQESGVPDVEPTLNYRIGAGDVIRIVVARQQLLSKDNVRVGNDGTIRIPMIDEAVPAACLTEVGLANSIAERYKKFLLNPQVNVDVVEFKSNPVALIGSVNQPGRFDVRRPTRLLELLTYVNGPAQNAGDDVQIIRTNYGYKCIGGRLVRSEEALEQDVISIKLSKTLEGELDSNPYVEAGDIITVSEAAAIPEAYVIGNVGRAMAIKLNERTTLTKAIAMAGGTVRGAEISKIKILRQDPETFAKTEIIVNLKEVRKDGSKDIVLKQNDIVEVPGPSGAKKFFGDIFKVLVPTATRVVRVY